MNNQPVKYPFERIRLKIETRLLIIIPIITISAILAVIAYDFASLDKLCVDDGCLPLECKNSKSPKDCPNCTWDECCCWKTIHS
ncbi:MAG: hypothetical protein EPO37_00980 [Nitrosarchaeum sp.]|nr:MAG: hypothetical protein EPO37_00980 [Nitrosarchaeum sp.]